MKLIGLTGGVACGKTTVAQQCRGKGIPVIDTDEIAHNLLSHDPEIQKTIQKNFGTLDRSELRKMVFTDNQRRSQLETILHPKIWAQVKNQLKALESRSHPPKFAMIVIPLLFETNAQNRFDQTIAVVSDEKNQLDRLMERDGISAALAKQMIQSQLPNSEKAKRADWTLTNNKDINSLTKSVDELLAEMLRNQRFHRK